MTGCRNMAHHLEAKSSKKCSKHESDKMELFDEKKTVYNTKQATVEVTVKLKRHKSSGTKLPETHLPYRKGSWGDLLSQNRAVEFQNAEKDDSSNNVKKKQSKCTFPEVCHSSKSNCLKIPITEELYLETHTHVGQKPQQEAKKPRVPSAKITLIQENEFLRTEIADLRREVDKIKSRKKPDKQERVPVILEEKPVPEQQPVFPLKRTSSKKIAETQTDGRPSVKLIDPKQPNVLDKSLEMENAALRREAMMLVAEMNKAKQEQQDYVTTIKELYQLAEILKNENQLLVVSHEEKQKIHERLVEALNENQKLKQHMDVLMVKRDENERAPSNDRVSKIRNVIRDVKSTIAEEINGLEKLRRSSIGKKRDSSKFDFNVGEDVSALLNDTHSSEIQRILNTKDAPPPPTVPFSEDRSSTQYYGVPNSSPKGSRYRPSPPHDMEFSPRVSTPVFSAQPTKGSSEMRFGTGDIGGNLETVQVQVSPGDRQLRSEQDLYRIDSCQSFMPLQVDMIHDDDPLSTSDYRSTTSSRSSPNRLPPY